MEKTSINNHERVLWAYNDLVEIVGLSRSAAYRLLNQQGMPVVRIGGRKYMIAEKFIEWLNQQTQDDAV